MAFLWLFVACVSICTRESGETHDQPIVSSSLEIKNAPDCEGCPLALPEATAPEHATFKLNLQVQLDLSPLTPLVNSSTDGVTFDRWLSHPSFAERPLERLPLLRI
jgi:hypothetical protein